MELELEAAGDTILASRITARPIAVGRHPWAGPRRWAGQDALRLIEPRTGQLAAGSQCPPMQGAGDAAKLAGRAPGSSRQGPGPLGRGSGNRGSRRRLQRNHVPPVRLQWTAAHPSGR